MKEPIVSFKTAKLAKEKGFNELCHFFYNQEFSSEKIKNKEIYDLVKNSEFEDGIMQSDEGDIPYFTYVAPTQTILQKWLREKHKIFVFCNHYEFGINEQNGFYFSITKSIKSGHISGKSKTYEEALEKGLLESLKLIK